MATTQCREAKQNHQRGVERSAKNGYNSRSSRAVIVVDQATYLLNNCGEFGSQKVEILNITDPILVVPWCPYMSHVPNSHSKRIITHYDPCVAHDNFNFLFIRSTPRILRTSTTAE